MEVLTLAFNQMTKQLQEAHDDLELRVEARTEELSESEQRYRELVDSARDVIYTMSPDGSIASLNPAFETITGWPCAEWLGKPFTSLIHPDDRELFSRGDRKAHGRRARRGD